MATAIDEKLLGQLRPATADPETLYTLGAGVRMIGKGLKICNTTNAKVEFSVYYDDDGTTFDQSTATAYKQTINGFTTVTDDTFMALATTGARIGVQSSVPNALTFSLFGAEVS